MSAQTKSLDQIIFDAIDKDDVAALRRVHKMGAFDPDAHGGGNDAAFKAACYNNHYECVKFLVENVRDLDITSHNLFQRCCASSSVDIIKLLVSNGANPRFESDISIQWAAVGGALDTVMYLIDYCGLSDKATVIKPDEKNNLEHALRKASGEGHIEVVGYLESIGVNIHHDRERPLREAAKYGHLDIVEYIASKGGNVNAANGEALRSACLYGHFDVVSSLIARGADIHVKNDGPLKLSAEAGQFDVFDLLFKQNPDYFSNLLQKDECLLGVDMAQAYLADQLLNGYSADRQKRRAAKI